MAAKEAWEPQGVGFLAVSIVDEDAKVAWTARRLGFDVRQAVTTGNLLAAIGTTEIPTTVMVSADGRIVGVARGERDEAFFRARAAELHADR